MNDKGGSGDKSNGNVESTSLYVLIGELLEKNENVQEESLNVGGSQIIDVSDSFNEMILNHDEMSSSTMSQ
jgi:hypothetical protein